MSTRLLGALPFSPYQCFIKFFCWKERQALNQLRLFNFFWRRARWCAVERFGVFKNFTLVIAQHHPVGVVAQNVVGIDGHFAAATGRVNDVLRRGVTGRVAAQLRHDFNALPDAGAQVRRAGNQIALVKVIRLHPAHEQFLDMRLHDFRVVVDVFEEDGLVAERNAGVSEAAQRVTDFRGQLARVVRVDAHEQRMEFFQHRTQFGRDALRQERRDARTDA